ncbi:MAG: succinate dehydrogenase, hydrophobic membrane anchor protein [bacterium]|nr:succinate dehydrogenase, hydrophobic membrane anchor protein [bacterium]
MIVIKRGIWSWFMQRITGLLLVVGMAIHFIILHFESHEPITFDRVVTRLQTPAWLLFDLILLGLVLYHGLNGLWAVLLDFAPEAKFKNTLGWFVSLFGIATFIFGFWALMAFTK